MAASTSNSKKNAEEFLQLSYDWKIKKVLKKSDVESSKVLLPLRQIKEYVLPNLGSDIVESINNGGKYEVTIRDLNTRTYHKLNMSKDKNVGCYTLKGKKWRDEFVEGKKLQEGDEIGFFWDSTSSVLAFSVLKKVPNFNTPITTSKSLNPPSASDDDNDHKGPTTVSTELTLKPPSAQLAESYYVV